MDLLFDEGRCRRCDDSAFPIPPTLPASNVPTRRPDDELYEDLQRVLWSAYCLGRSDLEPSPDDAEKLLGVPKILGTLRSNKIEKLLVVPAMRELALFRLAGGVADVSALEAGDVEYLTRETVKFPYRTLADVAQEAGDEGAGSVPRTGSFQDVLDSRVVAHEEDASLAVAVELLVNKSFPELQTLLGLGDGELKGDDLARLERLRLFWNFDSSRCKRLDAESLGVHTSMNIPGVEWCESELGVRSTRSMGSLRIGYALLQPNGVFGKLSGFIDVAKAVARPRISRVRHLRQVEFVSPRSKSFGRGVLAYTTHAETLALVTGYQAATR
ncbi:MAG: hypothetical protein U0610_19030 [bacterium]